MNVDGIINSLRGRSPGILGQNVLFRSAVTVPLLKQEGKLCILFEERSLSLDKQPGEICFPGGKIDACDPSEKEAARRETMEELGLKENDIEILAPLDVLLTPFNVVVYPFACQIKPGAVITPNPDEVDSVFMVPVEYLLSHQPILRYVRVKLVPPPDYPYELIPHGRNYPWREGAYPQLFYLWEDKVIWGLTARILEHFLELLR